VHAARLGFFSQGSRRGDSGDGQLNDSVKVEYVVSGKEHVGLAKGLTRFPNLRSDGTNGAEKRAGRVLCSRKRRLEVQELARRDGNRSLAVDERPISQLVKLPTSYHHCRSTQ
jgi:hypothetical protein